VSVTESKLRFILNRALKDFSEPELFDCVKDKDIILRTLAACEIHLRGTPSCFEFALVLLKSFRYEDREIGAFILGQLAPSEYKFSKQSVRPLLELFADPYYEVRAAAAEAFLFLVSGMKEEIDEIIDKILLLAIDPEDSVRLSVANTLGFIYDEKANAVLLDLLDDINSDVRDAADFGLSLHAEHRIESKK
jgi:HEAT repeat protein